MGGVISVLRIFSKRFEYNYSAVTENARRGGEDSLQDCEHPVLPRLHAVFGEWRHSLRESVRRGLHQHGRKGVNRGSVEAPSPPSRPTSSRCWMWNRRLCLHDGLPIWSNRGGHRPLHQRHSDCKRQTGGEVQTHQGSGELLWRTLSQKTTPRGPSTLSTLETLSSTSRKRNHCSTSSTDG